MTTWLKRAFDPTPPFRGRKMSPAELEASKRQEREYGQYLLGWIEYKIQRLRSNNMGVILYLEMIELAPNDSSHLDEINDELDERDDRLQELFENLHQLFDHDVPLTQTIWNFNCAWGSDFLS